MDLGFEIELEPELHATGLSPGASADAALALWAVEDLPALVVGQRFEIREGVRVVGTGTVLQS